MRIITGTRKGHRLKPPAKSSIRPTSGRVRTAIFNIIPLDLSGTRVLDLYAGTGILGMEALSRGALSAVFVEAEERVVKNLAANLRRLNLLEPSRIMAKRVLPALKLLAAEGQRFDLVFADPPYQSRDTEKVLFQLGGLELLSPEAMVVVEHAVGVELAENYGRLTGIDRREYGDSAVSFFQWREK